MYRYLAAFGFNFFLLFAKQVVSSNGGKHWTETKIYGSENKENKEVLRINLDFKSLKIKKFKRIENQEDLKGQKNEKCENKV